MNSYIQLPFTFTISPLKIETSARRSMTETFAKCHDRLCLRYFSPIYNRRQDVRCCPVTCTNYVAILSLVFRRIFVSPRRNSRYNYVFAVYSGCVYLCRSKLLYRNYRKVIVRPLSTVGYTSVAASVIHSRQWSN